MVKVGVIMGSISDWSTMQEACKILDDLRLDYETEIISAHRTPEDMFTYAEEARGKGIKVIIAGAGGAAHLPGMVAAKTTLPVIGVPVQSKALDGLDSLLSIVQMPGGVPVATVAIGSAGAKNAGILAAEMVGAFNDEIAVRLTEYRGQMKEKVTDMRRELREQ
ncbi:5-(carboxyamino)imidazole ribonucleotide mutase [Halobacillus shinanisalinarum]|uniref:N5-carboxyaminoimidazole ribonucleotide mutase n=1 Tax=Halobacillus shinanisalinarum TaxID=2932258 RepID=A0ABY4GV13_9BACI|nr:5-(carboxyamino)imidazole ribonucleotide mutase [Halobacillus shinanisalinarum]UOQ92007.1 5-(carboxyamino)imidazole ribonucleotide mutase [Halobacillus shinanisalinarum]